MKHKKQHWIPQSYLQEWCDQNTPEGYNKYIWAFMTDGSNVKKRALRIFFTNKICILYV